MHPKEEFIVFVEKENKGVRVKEISVELWAFMTPFCEFLNMYYRFLRINNVKMGMGVLQNYYKNDQ